MVKKEISEEWENAHTEYAICCRQSERRNTGRPRIRLYPVYKETKCLIFRFLYMQITGLNKGRRWKEEEEFRALQRLITSPSAVDVTPLAGCCYKVS